MSKVYIKKANGEREISSATGEPIRMHAIDANERVKAGDFIAEWDTVQMGDQKRKILVAIRKKGPADLKREKKEKAEAIAKLKDEAMELDEAIARTETKEAKEAASSLASGSPRSRAKVQK